MALLESPICNFGWKAVDFSLKGVDGKTYRLADVKGANGLLVMFICNHCPYVKAVLDRLVRDAADLQKKGVGIIAVMSNDQTEYPEDSFDNMKALARSKGFTFPYVVDETQETARAYDAVCTPDFFGFNADLELQYRGRLDSSCKEPATSDTRRELFEAMSKVAASGCGPKEQFSSIGCSIKWK
ncbi:MAG: alkyl hydroperoxide reductase [Rhodospirillales bacterium RIFCSPLOWO2_12_FULL_58_28]|nr:MAG: alkyl hydroperoxide reductase [Rhodospirillales bacterium RIFCSPLOWO2_02_FULL_58_16]OHC78902.1 MAG: alkyl hydroperoxide reductase [Rhodospirillales bacterium RIFCSPLOWO2_12_FULL_58_28]